MTRTPCGAELEEGKHCRGFALPSGLCWNHDPARADEHLAARRKGQRLAVLHGKRARLDTPQGLMRFLSAVIYDCRDGTLEPGMARTLAYCASVQHRLVESGELEQRIAALEAAQQQYRKGVTPWRR